MMAKKSNLEPFGTYKFRVIVDTEEDVFRDLELATSSTFAELHRSILEHFDFEDGEMASFYLSNEEWEKGLEIPLMDMDDGVVSMENAVLHEMVHQVGDKILYVYDFMRMWIFYVELVEVGTSQDDKSYPHLALSFGEAPDQDSKEMDSMFEADGMEEDMSAGGDDEEGEDEYGFGDDENFDSNEFDGYYDER
ncbi:MAG: hypothetical protein RL062_1471 [Bacteroidota bacterium]|jgi:hypothetical protein